MNSGEMSFVARFIMGRLALFAVKSNIFFTFIFQLSTLALVAPLCFALHCQGRT